RSGTSTCARCDTVVIAATGEPTVLLPPLVRETVGRDIGDLVFERLAVLRAGASPGDPGAYTPGLASRWERTDSLTWRFHLRPKATWHDARAVTADDVRFSFEAYADSVLDTGARSTLAGEIRAEAENDSTVLIRFRRPRSEQLYDATWHVRILARHLWDSVPRNRWAADSSLARLVGSGQFRVTSWSRGQSLTLERAAPGPAGIRRVVWRFTQDQDAALNLALSHEVDLLETLTTPAARSRVGADSSLRTIPYPA